MLILPDWILAVGGSQEAAAKWLEPLNDATTPYEIDSLPRVAAFLAQIAHESGSFKYVRELWGPTPAQQGYEGRLDLGNVQPGDGKRFMGRGLVQITGRNNYADMSTKLGADFIANPEWLEIPTYAALSAACFWQTRGLNELADKNEFRSITRRINGGYNGLEDRIERWDALKMVMGVA